jgi:hypothetical protein
MYGLRSEILRSPKRRNRLSQLRHQAPSGEGTEGEVACRPTQAHIVRPLSIVLEARSGTDNSLEKIYFYCYP